MHFARCAYEEMVHSSVQNQIWGNRRGTALVFFLFSLNFIFLDRLKGTQLSLFSTFLLQYKKEVNQILEAARAYLLKKDDPEKDSAQGTV